MTRRRAPGTGSITRHRDGWLLRWWQAGQREGEMCHGTHEEAERRLDAIMAQLAAEGGLGRARTFREHGELYLDREERRGRRMAAYRSRWRCHVASAEWAGWAIDDVAPSDLRRWIDDLEARLSPRSVRHCVYLASSVFRDAMERDLCDKNPVSAVRKPATDETRIDHVLTAEQVEALELLETEDEPLRVVALTLVGVGLRPGELLGLRLDEVRLDGDRPHLTVRRSGRRTTRTKTGRPRRVELFGIGLNAVTRWIRVVRPRLKVRGTEVERSPWAYPIPPGWLRTDSRGRLGALLAEVGARDIHAHDLRGTCATHLLSGTHGPPWTIAEVAAHIGDSVVTTQRSYAHLADGAARRAAAEMPRRRGIREGSGASSVAAISSVDPLVGHEGLEPSANGLRGHREPEAIRLVCPSGIHRGSHLRALALRAAEAIAAGEPFAVARAVELVDAVLAATAETEADRRAGGAS